jgi:Family of unknown function (DUF6082)
MPNETLQRTAIRVATVAGVAVLGLAALVVAPLSLILLDKWFPTAPWERLSAIGQSYTGPAAILSAIALVALVFTVRLQEQSTRLSQLQSVREMQSNLLTLAIQDGDVGKLFDAKSEVPFNHAAVKRKLYRTMSIRYLQLAYVIGQSTEKELRMVFSEELFTTPDDIDWWQGPGQQFWRASITNKLDRRFVDILDDEVGRAGRALGRRHQGRNPTPTE